MLLLNKNVSSKRGGAQGNSKGKRACRGVQVHRGSSFGRRHRGHVLIYGSTWPRVTRSFLRRLRVCVRAPSSCSVFGPRLAQGDARKRLRTLPVTLWRTSLFSRIFLCDFLSPQLFSARSFRIRVGCSASSCACKLPCGCLSVPPRPVRPVPAPPQPARACGCCFWRFAQPFYLEAPSRPSLPRLGAAVRLPARWPLGTFRKRSPRAA